MTSLVQSLSVIAGKMQNFVSFNEKIGYRKQPRGFATKAIHAGQSPEQWECRAVVPPLVTSTIYERPGPDGESGYQYTRYKNPTRDVLEKCLASLDNAEFALAFSAGVSAITSIINLLESGDHIVSSNCLYGGTIRIFRDLATKMGIEVTYVDFDDLPSVEKVLKAKTKFVWIETPTNPTMKILDIKEIADFVHKKSKALLVVDNTFLTPYFQRPLELGADVSLISMSKFTNGHSDVTMGAVTTNNQDLYEKLKYFQVSTGMVASPHECQLANRSLKTLAVRMEKHSQNSYEVAKFLESHPKIEKVFHPSLKTHEKHEIALDQSYGHSGIMAFHIKGSYVNTKKFFQNLKLVLVTQSLGGVETNASFPWTMSHSDLPEDERIKAGVTDTLVRLSVGLEDVGEIIEDLEKALMEV